jgi:hypothetical protein
LRYFAPVLEKISVLLPLIIGAGMATRDSAESVRRVSG